MCRAAHSVRLVLPSSGRQVRTPSIAEKRQGDIRLSSGRTPTSRRPPDLASALRARVTPTSRWLANSRARRLAHVKEVARMKEETRELEYMLCIVYPT
jgi:hypothetical protein